MRDHYIVLYLHPVAYHHIIINMYKMVYFAFPPYAAAITYYHKVVGFYIFTHLGQRAYLHQQRIAFLPQQHLFLVTHLQTLYQRQCLRSRETVRQFPPVIPQLQEKLLAYLQFRVIRRFKQFGETGIGRRMQHLERQQFQFYPAGGQNHSYLENPSLAHQFVTRQSQFLLDATIHCPIQIHGLSILIQIFYGHSLVITEMIQVARLAPRTALYPQGTFFQFLFPQQETSHSQGAEKRGIIRNIFDGTYVKRIFPVTQRGYQIPVYPAHNLECKVV